MRDSLVAALWFILFRRDIVFRLFRAVVAFLLFIRVIRGFPYYCVLVSDGWVAVMDRAWAKRVLVVSVGAAICAWLRAMLWCVPVPCGHLETRF